ncbi:MAG: hypothetical protein IJR83_02710 [Clostridia bacterium]|nr:hypothetical protein [Clostridia bacterium]
MFSKGRTICCLLLCICLLCSCAGGLAPGTESGSGSATETQEQGGEEPVKHKYGLHVESDGTVTLEEKPFWGVGLNYFGEFGDMGDMESDPTCGEVFDQVVGWILEAGIQICSSWQFQDFTSAEPNETKFKVSQKYNL